MIQPSRTAAPLFSLPILYTSPVNAGGLAICGAVPDERFEVTSGETYGSASSSVEGIGILQVVHFLLLAIPPLQSRP